VERSQVELIDGIEDEVGQVIRRQPILKRRRHEEELVAIGADEVVAGHAYPPAARSTVRILLLILYYMHSNVGRSLCDRLLTANNGSSSAPPDEA
jgi:hypothetical protein